MNWNITNLATARGRITRIRGIRGGRQLCIFTSLRHQFGSSCSSSRWRINFIWVMELNNFS
jgi:hypothetical protein